MNTSWASGPRWQRNLLVWDPGDDKIQGWQVLRVVGACCLLVTFGVLIWKRYLRGPKRPMNCDGSRLGLRATMRRIMGATRRRRQRRRKTRPRTQWSRRLVAKDAVWIGGRRFAGRKSKGLMGFRCGRRQGEMGLFVPVPVNVPGDLLCDVPDGVPPRLWEALVRNLGVSAARKCCELREGTQEPARVSKTQRAKNRVQERAKSLSAQEADGPTASAMDPPDPGRDGSPPGLPVGDVPPRASHGNGTKVQCILEGVSPQDDWLREVPLVQDLGVSAARKCCELREGTQEPARVNKTQRAKSRVQERAKSLRAKEAEGPAACAMDPSDPGRDGSPPGLPIGDMPPCASHGNDTKVRGILEDVSPQDWLWTKAGWQQWGHFCRGGAGPSELLSGLQELLAKVKQEDSGKAKGKGAKGAQPKGGGDPPAAPSAPGGDNKGKGQGGSISNDAELVLALEGLVKAAKKDPSHLLDQLQKLVEKAVLGYGQGRAARRARAKEKAASGTAAGAANVESETPAFCKPVGTESQGDAWVTVVSKKRQQQGQVQQWTIDPLVGGLVGFGVAKTRLTNGEALKAHLVVANDALALSALLSLAKAHELTEKVAVVCRFEPTEGATTLQLPSVGPKGQKQVRSWPAVALGVAGKPEIKHSVVIKTSYAVPDRKLSTLRVQIPREFQDGEAWTAVCKQPAEHTVKALGAFHSFGMWQKLQAGEQGQRESVLECYGKVTEERRATILGKSGTHGVFVMELARDGPKQFVEWVDPGSLLGPAYLQAVERKAGTAKTAIAFRRGGGASLGLRLEPNKVGDRVCTWRARHVPRDWTPDDLIGALGSAGLTDCEAKAPFLGCCVRS